MKDVLIKIFSYKGKFTGVEFANYGVGIPLLVALVLLYIGSKFEINEGLKTIFILLFFITFLSIQISSIIKRARDLGGNVPFTSTILMILFSFLSPVMIVYLVFASSQPKGEGRLMKHLGYFSVATVLSFSILIWNFPDYSLVGQVMEKAEISLVDKMLYNFSDFSHIESSWDSLVGENSLVLFGVIYLVLFVVFYMKFGKKLGTEMIDGTSVSILVPSFLAVVITGGLFFSSLKLTGDVHAIEKRLAIASKNIMQKERDTYILEKVSLTDQKKLLALESKMIKLEDECQKVHCIETVDALARL